MAGQANRMSRMYDASIQGGQSDKVTKNLAELTIKGR